MAEDFEGGGLEIRPAGSASDPLAAHLAIKTAGESSEEAREFLRRQCRLADLQTENLRLQNENLGKQDEYELSHLRWRRFNDQMRGAMHMVLAALGALAVIGICAAVWNASRAQGFVIEAFSVPPGYAQRGMAGDVVAGDITDKIASIRQFANLNSFSRSKEVSEDRKENVRVEIPETAISVAEAWRYLRNWLGDERHLTGSLRDTGAGQATLTLSAPGAANVSVSGAAADLARLEAQAAEQMFGRIDPVNYVNYLTAKGRHREALAAAKHYASIAVGIPERSDSFALWSYTTFEATGDFALAIQRARIGIGIDPKLAATRVQLMNEYFYLGRYEDALREARPVLTLNESDQLAAHRSGGFAAMLVLSAGRAAYMLGDFADAASSRCGLGCAYPEQALSRATNLAREHDVSNSRDLIASALAAGASDGGALGQARYYADAAADDWQAAVAEAKAAAAAYAEPKGNLSGKYIATVEATRFAPPLAVAEAHTGDFATAHSVVDATPADCYECALARGNIDAIEKQSGAASSWFARTIALGPSIPFAYADWGEMLLADGNYDAAIAKFRLANQKGPHFADPLEMWGEALMAKNRSDLALAKFEEANKYAPNWGRLHLKWGEALFYAGQKTEAEKQFAVASQLDLSQPDKAVLAKLVNHG